MKVLFSVGASLALLWINLGCGSGVVSHSDSPAISQVSPQTVAAGTTNLTIKVMGSNFSNQATVLWNGSSLATTVVNSTTLAASVSNGEVASPAVAQLVVQDVEGQTSAPVPVVITAAGATISPLTIVAPSLGSALLGTAYAATLQATGGTPAYTWSLTAGSLPAGLTLSPTGAISGTPTASGTSSFTATVSDSSTPVLTKSISLSVTVAAAVAPLTIVRPSLEHAQIGTAYAATLQATGGTPAYTWSTTAGSLPAGLTLSPTGAISGTPTSSGRSRFTATVTDSSTPALTKSVSLSITVAAAVTSLTIVTPSLSSAQVGTAYAATLQASGGTPAYTWSLTAGSLPAGLTLTHTGAISGTPTVSGTSSFTATVTDSSTPALTKSVSLSITVAAAVTTLTIAAPSLGSPQVGTAYAATLQAGGGTPAYTWSITSGSLPAGLTLAATTGVIAGTPTTAGTTNLVVAVTDNGSPVQKASSSISITVSSPQTATSNTTWYVRTDGGTRYTAARISNGQSGQCDGQGDAAYPGTGTNQHCAFSDVRYLWTDGTYNNMAWVGQGGDTYIIRGSIADGVSYRIGWQNNSNAYDPATDNYWGIAGNPYGSGMPAPPSGTAAVHTRILGGNYGSCHTQTARTQLHGGYGVSQVIDLTGTSYVEMQCLDVTDFSACGRSAQTFTCNTNIGSLDDYASIGVNQTNTTTNLTISDMRIHGTAGSGLYGPNGNGNTYSYIEIIGNAASGWNADNGTTGIGSALFQHYNISWNGCAEEYPIVDALPYADCTDDNSGGYGDGFGTATLTATVPWNISFDQGLVSYNTQDGLDALHLTGVGSSMTITRTLSYGNMGQQIKIGGQSGTAINNLIVTNCNALRMSIPGTPSGYNTKLSDFCRAADTGIFMATQDGATVHFDSNTVYSASATTVEIGCGGTCQAGTDLIDFRDNIILGFLNNTANGYVGGGTNDYANPIYLGSDNPFTDVGSVFDHNDIYHGKSTWTCPSTSYLHETNDQCTDPGLTDETWYPYAYGNMTPLSAASPIVGNGITLPGVTLDYAGTTRPSPPAIGAEEPGSVSPVPFVEFAP